MKATVALHVMGMLVRSVEGVLRSRSTTELRAQQELPGDWEAEVKPLDMDFWHLLLWCLQHFRDGEKSWQDTDTTLGIFVLG